MACNSRTVYSVFLSGEVRVWTPAWRSGDRRSILEVTESNGPGTGSVRNATADLSTPFAWVRWLLKNVVRLRVEVSHPNDKNKNVARMGQGAILAGRARRSFSMRELIG